MRVPIPKVTDPALVSRRIFVSAHHVAFIKGIIEASEGLACMFAERGGELLLVAPACRASELDQLVSDLHREVGAIVTSAMTNGATDLNQNEQP